MREEDLKVVRFPLLGCTVTIPAQSDEFQYCIVKEDYEEEGDPKAEIVPIRPGFQFKFTNVDGSEPTGLFEPHAELSVEYTPEDWAANARIPKLCKWVESQGSWVDAADPEAFGNCEVQANDPEHPELGGWALVRIVRGSDPRVAWY
jgi:hypothetical protein